jgi:integrase
MMPHGRREPPKESQVQIVKNSIDDPDVLPAVVYLCTGERRGESCGIQLQDIDFDHNIIHITKAVELVYNQPQITVTKTSSGRFPCCSCSKMRWSHTGDYRRKRTSSA